VSGEPIARRADRFSFFPYEACSDIGRLQKPVDDPIRRTPFLFLESLDRAETVDAESKRPLPAVDGAIKVFQDFLRRGLPRVSLLFCALPFGAGGAIGGFRCRDLGNYGAMSAFLVGDLASCSARSSPGTRRVVWIPTGLS
jgi:hypothetical protein